MERLQSKSNSQQEKQGGDTEGGREGEGRRGGGWGAGREKDVEADRRKRLTDQGDPGKTEGEFPPTRPPLPFPCLPQAMRPEHTPYI